jgi:hypothetical protein
LASDRRWSFRERGTMIFRRRKVAPEPPTELQELVRNVTRWIIQSGGTSAFAGKQGTVVSTPIENCRVEVCIAGNERQAFHVLFPHNVATIIFSLSVGGSSHYLETKWPPA